jgi:hypothetical protein
VALDEPCGRVPGALKKVSENQCVFLGSLQRANLVAMTALQQLLSHHVAVPVDLIGLLLSLPDRYTYAQRLLAWMAYLVLSGLFLHGQSHRWAVSRVCRHFCVWRATRLYLCFVFWLQGPGWPALFTKPEHVYGGGMHCNVRVSSYSYSELSLASRC